MDAEPVAGNTMTEYRKLDEWRRDGYAVHIPGAERKYRCDFVVTVRHWTVPQYDSIFGGRPTGPHRWAVYIHIFAVSPIGPTAIAEGRDFVADWPGNWDCSYFHPSHDESSAVTSVEYGWDFEHYNDSHADYDVDDCAIFLRVADRIYDRAIEEIAKVASP